MEKNSIYVPNVAAKGSPGWATIDYNGKKVKVGIGGDVELYKKPPKLPIKIKEATPDQYKFLHELGYTHLVDEQEVRSEVKGFTASKKKD